jgi:hypothetical protein
MSTSAPGAIKSYYMNFKKIEIKYLHTCKHSEDTVKKLEKNILYIKLYKKDKFLTNIRPYTYPQICFFPVAQNTMQLLAKLLTSIRNVYVYS